MKHRMRCIVLPGVRDPNLPLSPGVVAGYRSSRLFSGELNPSHTA